MALKWKPKLTIDQSIDLTIEWYKAYQLKKDLYKLTKKQIEEYLKL